MTDHSSLGPWIRRFLLEHVVAERNLTRNTQQSYRDAFCLLLPFASRVCKKPVISSAFAIYRQKSSASFSRCGEGPTVHDWNP